ncbi:MAG TPA: CocE/NonD family hydrolase [Gaiellaceae bacterium]|jgi:hypothetical protein
MRSGPLFLPSGAEHLSAVLVLPDGEVRGLAVFPIRIAVFGLRGTFWGQAAALLAERGVASVRFECVGSGDSTGEAIVQSPAEVAGHTANVVEFLLEALRLDSFGVAGACYNGAAALAAARDPRCIAAVSINTPSFDPGRLGRLRRRVAGWRVVDAIRVRPALRRALPYDRLRVALRDNASSDVEASLARSTPGARILLIHDEFAETRNLAPPPGRVEIRRDIAFGAIRIDGVDLSSGEEEVLAVVVDWLAAALSGNEVPRSEALA